MADDGTSRRPDDAGSGDVVEFGPPRPPGRSRRWLPLVAVALVAVPLAVAAVRTATPSTPASTATPTPTSSGQRAVPSSPEGTVTPSRVTVTDTRDRLLGVTGGWELFGRGPRGVVRIELARGRITRTAVPTLRSTGPVSFVVGEDRAIVRPLDHVPGYVVPDGGPTRPLGGALGEGGPALPGPDPRHLWAPAGHGADGKLLLVDLDGRRTGTSVQVPATGRVTPDGHGYPLVDLPSGVYQARPSGLRRITTGSVVAVGRTGWLAVECDARHRCTYVSIARADGERHVVPGRVAETMAPTGLISPDGSTAAVYRRKSTAGFQLRLIDLGTGADDRVHVEPRTFPRHGLAWSPDSRLLAVVTSKERLVAVDAGTHRTRDLGVALPPVDQIAGRAA